MKFLKYIIPVLFLGFFLNIPNLQAQESTIVKGTVVSQTDNSPLIGATVVEMDKDKRYISGTIADVNGNFALKIQNKNNIIVISFIGFKSMEFPATSSNINAVLEEEKITLEAVEIRGRTRTTVNNGIFTIDDRDAATSVKKINVKDLEDLPSASIDDALQGRIAGVDIVALSGDPGAGSTIKIRNASSLSGSTDPLLVMDGIPIETRVNNQFNLGAATSENFAQLLNIPLDDINDISVLTDAASTAVYGTRASNGVILINTKRGTKGKVQVNYTYRGTLNYQPDPVPMLSGDEYATLIPEAYMNYNDRPMNIASFTEFKNDPTDPLYYNYNKNTDWLKAVTQTGLTHDHNLSFTGGGEKAKYRLSLNYINQQGTTIGTGLDRITTSLNVDYDVSEKIRFSADFRYVHVDNPRNFLWDNNSNYNVRSVAYRKMPNQSIYEYDEYGNPTSNYFAPEFNSQGVFPGSFNPVAMANNAKSTAFTDQVIPTFRLNYRIKNWLTYAFDVRFTFTNNVVNEFLPQIATGRVWYDNFNNNATDDDRQSYDVYTKNALLFTPKLNEKHKLSWVLAVTTSTGDGYRYNVYGTNTASSELQDATDYSRIYSSYIGIAGVESAYFKYKSYAGIFAGTYSFADKYILNTTLRRDIDPKFGDNFVGGTFGGFGVKWRLSNENFMKKLTFIDDLTIRFNWGINGNSDINPRYGKYSNYKAYNFTYLGLRGVYPENLELVNFKWEQKTQPNLGMNLQMFKNRLNFDLNFWYEKVKDGFRKDMPLPSISGFSTVDVNVLDAHNKGFDLFTNYTILKKESTSTSIDLRFNCSWSQFIPDNISARFNNEVAWPTPVNGQFLYNPRDNTPLGSIFGLKYKGVYKDLESTIALDQNNNKIYNAKGEPIYMTYNYPDVRYLFQPGDAMYEDVNHDGNINYNDVVYLGNSNPLLTGGFGSTLRHKGFYADLYFFFRYGNKIQNQTKYETEKMTNFDNQSTAVLRRWRKEGDVTDIPRALLGSSTYNAIGSDRFIDDGSFIRLKTVTFGYIFTNKFLQKIHLSNAKLYCTITNLLTFTNYAGQDPEVSISPDPKQGDHLIAVDNARTPRSKDFTIGLNIGF